MNKELINKYKPEFDHWLNEGSVLINSDLGWCPIATEFTWSCNTSVNTLFIINDEYVEFRKALAEGKVIECCLSKNYHPNIWNYFDPRCKFNEPIDCYRIKPDESKFKIGDFVIHNGDIKQVTKVINGLIDCLDNSIALIYKEDTLELWTPVKGEWCWFYDNLDSKYSHLAQFYDMNISEDNSLSTFMSSHITKWYYCEPFLNSIPSYLKDK